MRRQRGFSLVELLVAMAATLIVTGAIYGLLSAGNSAFRRQPEVIDRQQNIRLAMDRISRDVFNAGAALPTFSQVFTRQENYAVNAGPCAAATGVNGCGIAGTMGPDAAAVRGTGDAATGDASQNSDVLEIVSTDEACSALTVCSSVNPGDAATYTTRNPLPACLVLPGFVLLANYGDAVQAFTIQHAALNTSAANACPGTGDAANNSDLDLAASVSPWSPRVAMPPPPPANATTFLYAAQVTRYMIAPAGDPIDTTLPALWRSGSGRYRSDDGTLAEVPGAGPQWELVARGIEDLQVEYMAGDLVAGNPVWHNLPPASVFNDWSTLVRQVRISLSARSSAPNIEGVTQAVNGPDALRGQLTTTISPRATFIALQTCLALETGKCDPSVHIQ